MISSLQRVAKRLAQKLAVGLLIGALVLAAGGFWLFLMDRVNFTAGKQEFLTKLNRDQQHTSAVLDDVNKQMAEMQAELAKQQAREQMLDKTIAELHKLRSWWDSWFGDREQQRAYADQLARDNQLKHDTAAREVELQRNLVRAQWEKDGLEIERGWLDKRIHAAETNQSRVVHYLMLAWDQMKWYAAVAIGLYFLGPTLRKFFIFFGIARLIESGRPVRLAENLFTLPQVSEIGPSLDTSLWPGERLWVKESFLKVADEGLWRRTRFMLDWRVPFTCLLCGLFDLVALRNTRAGREQGVTFASDGDPATELALVSVPDGGSLVLRPSFLKAVILSGDARLKIRRYWRFFTWRSWITLQFRFFEFAGPCRLLVASSRGVRVERLAEREGHVRPARRASQDSVVGFTPNLDYGLVRGEKFRAYFRNKSPLFDDLFTGPGLFLCQRTPVNGARKFWSDGWDDLLKIFGV
ncbi:MAG TPA: hypothetical protein VNW23_02525 [Opitutaceae bacterium]|jgi:hypothetical protein|nr:hypothetical protein [Opitutaceae bacterium]